MTPACTLSVAELGSSWRPDCCSIHSHVPGRICITPRALADETTPFWNPLSCHATAAASDGDTPWPDATVPMSSAVTWTGVGFGAAAGTTAGATGVGCCSCC